MKTYVKERLDRFMQVYGVELAKAVAEFPNEYAWPKDGMMVETVIGRIRATIERSGIHAVEKSGRAIKATAKRIGVKNTYAELNLWLLGEMQGKPYCIGHSLDCGCATCMGFGGAA